MQMQIIQTTIKSQKVFVDQEESHLDLSQLLVRIEDPFVTDPPSECDLPFASEAPFEASSLHIKSYS